MENGSHVPFDPLFADSASEAAQGAIETSVV